MLTRANRITRGAEYKAVVRGGARCAGANTVTYVTIADGSAEPRFGFIVSKQVGSAVVRNTVRRRLKAVCAEVIPELRTGSEIVIRALPSSARSDYATLRDEVRRCLRRRASA